MSLLLLTSLTAAAAQPGDAEAPGGEGAYDSGCGPVHAEPEPFGPPPADVRELQGTELDALRARILEIDRAFAANNLDSLREALASDGEGPRRNLECELRRILEGATVLSQETEIRKAIRIDDVDAVYTIVKSKLRPAATKETPWTFDRRETRGWTYFFRQGKKGPTLARIECWNERHRAWILAGTIRCNACPWSLPRPTGWFVVPREAGACAAFDSVSFVHASLKFSMDFDCYSSPCQESPRQAAERDQELLNQMLGVKPSNSACVLESETAEGIGRRVDLTFEVKREGAGRRTMRILRSYRSSAPFLFTFVARAEAEDFPRYAASAMAVIDSLDIDEGAAHDSERIERIAKSHMAPGRIDGEFVKDEVLGIAVKGPCGWIPTPQPGVGRFCVRFTPPRTAAKEDGVSVDKNSVDKTSIEKHAAGAPACGSVFEPSWTLFAWEDPVSPFGEPEIVRFFEGRRASILETQRHDYQVLRRESSEHPNGIDVVYEVESKWRQEGDGSRPATDMRELFVAIPMGRFLLCVVARAPQEEFERDRREFSRAIATLSHESRR